MLCLYQFKFIYPLANKNFYNYDLTALNNYADSKTFYVNKTLDCLSVQLQEGFEANRVNFLSSGMHVFNVTVNDSFKRTDRATCSIYVIKSCNQLNYVMTGYDAKRAYANRMKFIKYFRFLKYLFRFQKLRNRLKCFIFNSFLSELASLVFLRSVKAIYHDTYGSTMNSPKRIIESGYIFLYLQLKENNNTSTF